MAPIKYRRKYPKLNSKYRGGADVDGSENVAHLYLHPENRLGVGSHSTVYHAALQLPAPLTARTPNGRVRVAAKVSPHLGHVDEEMLCNEAEMYNAFPKHLAEDWCGYNLVPPDPHPVPVGAVVPKFYGFYEPYNIHGRSQRPGPILLLEECGEQICADSLTQDQKTECMSLIHRLHLERIVQGSCHARNILRQPGPLYLPPEQRSSETPSFRIIDFGRGRRFASAGLKLQDAVRSEQREARKTLWLDN
ncbi:hypothetical protein BDW22DRAFT_1328208 [Trametopsis cervina]|nr:hypothetical protein BDW22DRAFT_1328208 [Trametopsis cervina]